MFCDLVDSTRHAEQFDPEDWREIVSNYHDTCEAVVRRFDGSVAERLGDGMVCYFGWPVAHENDAYRAVRTAFGVFDAMETLNAQLERRHTVRLQVRIGIDTGTVVIGEMSDGQKEDRATGNALNIAARLQNMAPPDGVVISGATFDLVRAYIKYEDLGVQQLRNMAKAVHVYRVVSDSGIVDRLDAADGRGVTPLIGRGDQLGTLLALWDRTAAGQSQMAFISGEPGIGKSRLVRDLRHHVSNSIEFRCSPYDSQSALFPVISRLQRLLGFDELLDSGERLDRLEQKLGGLGFDLSEVAPIMAGLLSLPLLDRYPPPALSVPQKRRLTLGVMVTWLIREAEQQPLMAIWEDLHWADPSTVELLGMVIDRAQPETPLFSLLTFRTGEFQPHVGTCRSPTEFALSRLERLDVHEMVAKLTGGRPLPAEVVDQIVEKTDGVPLFVEELLQALIASGFVIEEGGRFVLARSSAPPAIPATLEDSLMSRLDRLGPAKGVAQLGSILGRSFSKDLILAVLGTDAKDDDERTEAWRHAERSLTQLVDVGVLQPRAGFTAYEFKHALIRDAAYQSLLKRTRQTYHLRTALVLETQFAHVAETQPELVARHYTEASQADKALDYWHKAGERARGRSANVEAIHHFDEALRVLAALPEDDVRDRRELAVRVASITPLIAIKGYNTGDTADTLSRALEIGRKVGEVAQLFPVLYGHWVNRLVSGKYSEALRLSQDFLDEATMHQDPVPRLVGHRLVGFSRFSVGDLAVARENLQASLTLYDAERDGELKNQGYAQDPRCSCEAFMSLVRWLQGFPDEAAAWSRASIEHARGASHSNTWGYTLCFGGVTSEVLRRDVASAERHASELLRFAEDEKLPVWLAYGRVMHGWAVAQTRATEENISEMRAGLVHFEDAASRTAASDSMSMGFMKSFLLSLLGEALGKQGRREEGLIQLDAAWAFAEASQEGFWNAEIQRLKGELLIQAADGGSDANHQAAEVCFLRAQTIASQQGARALELRAAMSLGRLRRREDPDNARRVLEAVQATFTEGFDSADLTEARRLSDELSAR